MNHFGIYVVTRRCAAATCGCQEGRGYSDVEGAGDWEVVLCDLCGGNGSHLGCWEAEEQTYVCRDCGGDGPELESRDLSVITINSSLNSTVDLSLNSTMDLSLNSSLNTTYASEDSIMKLLESSTSEGESLVLEAVEKEKEKKTEAPKKEYK